MEVQYSIRLFTTVFSYLYLTGNVAALEDLWIVGDAFVPEVFAVFQASKVSVDMNNREVPFLYRMFNIFYFSSSKLSNGRNVLLRVINAFTEGLNRRQHLPKYIIILLDKDILSMLDLDVAGLTKQLERCIAWLAKQMTKLIEARKEKLYKMKQGAVPSSDEFPTLIWVELFDKPYTRNRFIQENRNKFNKGINEVALHEKNCRVTAIESLGIRHFTLTGALNYEGKQQLWRDINYQMNNFYKKKTDLNPRYYIANPMIRGREIGYNRSQALAGDRRNPRSDPEASDERTRRMTSDERARRTNDGAEHPGHRERSCYHQHSNGRRPARQSLFDDFN